MEYYLYHHICYASLGGAVPAGAVPVAAPIVPLVLTVRRDPVHSRGFWAITDLGQLTEPQGPAALVPQSTPEDAPAELAAFVKEHGASVLNTTFPGAFAYVDHWFSIRPRKWKVTLVGLGDVGGTVLMALKLLGREIGEIQIFDFNEAQCKRYEMELNQVLPMDQDQPVITICREEQLFDCDLFLFTASRGVPPVGQEQVDVRMAQYEANRTMITAYAKLARAAKFRGLFCQISDPVDLLCRAAFEESNKDENGEYDWKGLLPEQVEGYGLGVMNARAAFYAARDERFHDFLTEGRAFGPHGKDLVIANSITEYNDELSRELTKLAVEANLRTRETGFKPYVAPALSSGAISLLLTLRGEWHYSASFLGGAYMGARSRRTSLGIEREANNLPKALTERLATAYTNLKSYIK